MNGRRVVDARKMLKGFSNEHDADLAEYEAHVRRGRAYLCATVNSNPTVLEIEAEQERFYRTLTARLIG